MSRLNDLGRLYDLLDELRDRLGGYLTLENCHGRLNFPIRGVYFFFEETERRASGNKALRITRVGTHALTSQSKTTLWRRMAQHAGNKRSGAGNHRGSIFRLLVGEAMLIREAVQEPRSWGLSSDASAAGVRLGQTAKQVLEQEHELECSVSRYIRAMPFLYVSVQDSPGSTSERAIIERNCIGLLSNFRREVVDSPSSDWLGKWSRRDRVRESGLWNNNHVDEPYSAELFSVLGRAIRQTQPFSTIEKI